MSWQGIIKNVKFDPKESCCADLKNKWVRFIHSVANYYEAMVDNIKISNEEKVKALENEGHNDADLTLFLNGINADTIRRYDELADWSCEELVQEIEEMVEDSDFMALLPVPRMQSDLKKILDEFKECMDEPAKEKNPTDWMNQLQETLQ